MTLTRWLVMMVKLPVAGAVKTRLARDAGVAAAVRFYRTTMTETIRRLSVDPRWRLVLAVTPDASAGSPVWPRNVARVHQGAGHLGDRMQRIFDILPPGPVCIIGSDIPNIRADNVTHAFQALGEADAVFGPAGDGGYWLVGARRRPRTLRFFNGVRWSSEHALRDTVANLSGKVVAEVECLDDVDDGNDLRRWLRTR